MVDRRKKLHNELSATIADEFKHVFQSAIPFQSLIERMGVWRQPVPAFAPRSQAAFAYQMLWGELETTVLARPSSI
jgi:hypothetical protein